MFFLIDLSRSESDQETLDRIVALSMLYDFYGSMLKEQKRQVFEDYILNDLSLSEIASERGISRQAVHDTVKRCEKELLEYENKLCLIHKFNIIKEKVSQIHEAATHMDGQFNIEDLSKIENLSNEILDVL